MGRCGGSSVSRITTPLRDGRLWVEPAGPACVVGQEQSEFSGRRGPQRCCQGDGEEGEEPPTTKGYRALGYVATTHSISKTLNGSKNVNFLNFLHGSHVEMKILWRYCVK